MDDGQRKHYSHNLSPVVFGDPVEAGSGKQKIHRALMARQHCAGSLFNWEDGDWGIKVECL